MRGSRSVRTIPSPSWWIARKWARVCTRRCPCCWPRSSRSISQRIEVLAAPVGDAYVNPLNGGQITGTSNSIQDAWEKLRTAGAQARLMLIAAAARKWRVDPGECRAADGRVTNTRGNSLRYGDLAARRGEAAGAEGCEAQAGGGFSAHRQAPSSARHAGQGRRHGRVRIGREAPRDGVCRHRALSDRRWDGGRGGFRRCGGVARRASRAVDVERRRGRRRSFLAGAQGAQCAEDQLGSGRERAPRQRRLLGVARIAPPSPCRASRPR